MHLKQLTLAVTLVAATAAIAHTTASQDGAKTQDAPAFDMADMMPSPPGAEHKEMAQSVGRWKVTGKFFIPGMPPMDMNGTSTMEMFMDGHYMKETFEGVWMGQPFVGQNLLAYNVDAGVYESLWIDSGSTGMGYSVGKKRADGVIEFHGTMRDKQTPEGRPVRSEAKDVSPTEMLFRMYDTGPDGEYLAMELAYTKS